MKVVFLYGVILFLFLVFAFAAFYFRISGDLQVCRSYYKEMSLAQCYFSSKTVRVPEGK